MKPRFCVGYNGTLEDLEKILGVSTRVTSVYTGGLEGVIAGGRPQYVRALGDLAPQIAYAHDRGAAFEIALNAPCGFPDKSRTGWWDGIRAYLRELDGLGVDRVAVSHPFLMALVKSETRMGISVSTICEVMTPQAARYYESLGGDIITVSMNVNMDLRRLREIKRALRSAKLRILVNESCLRDCPWRRFHHSHYAHSSTEADYHGQCKKVYLERPYLLLANTVIRPEDRVHYDGVIDDYKIVGRLVPAEDLLLRIAAYAQGKFRGNYVRLFDSKLAALFAIPNEKLGGLIRKKWACDGVCEKCLYCARLFDRVVEKQAGGPGA